MIVIILVKKINALIKPEDREMNEERKWENVKEIVGKKNEVRKNERKKKKDTSPCYYTKSSESRSHNLKQTPQGTVLHARTVLQLVQKHFTFWETRRFITS